ncbi:acyl-CoA carboxylase subunit epsilon (plasmid) [Streptomyces sp. NBC_01591]|uniref:acyl-CoA carboxylase epsilon subunit n=1 Tax=Streptomyces sp. NBC_01591 TaxID=2975888 RepID=UPI002DD9B1EA|nr:acyl-CoA carboxylase epsilon subunit [Streptomyces sp. NBC_01591]WSD73865.1 acyl-CoA carboxylase subunit epsilon [Streptomyces sp. NBC_01591]
MTAPGNETPAAGLTSAAVHVSKGNPTAEEVAALAVLLTARIRLANEALANEAREQARTSCVAPLRALRHRGPVPFTPPGAWAS